MLYVYAVKYATKTFDAAMLAQFGLKPIQAKFPPGKAKLFSVHMQ